jgi:hypothetical protein
MRAILLVIAFLVLVALALVWTNVIDIDWNDNASAPVEVGINPPTIETGTTNVQVPTARVVVPDGDNAAATNGQQ